MGKNYGILYEWFHKRKRRLLIVSQWGFAQTSHKGNALLVENNLFAALSLYFRLGVLCSGFAFRKASASDRISRM